MKTYAVSLIAVSLLAALSPFAPNQAVYAVVGGGGGINGGGKIPIPYVAPAPVVRTVITGSVSVTSPVSTSTHNALAPVQITGGTLGTLQPKDLTHPNLLPPNPLYVETLVAINGIKAIPDLNSQPGSNNSGEYILVRSNKQSIWEKTSATSVKLTDGTVLVSVRRPSRFALINTPDGVVNMSADGDVLVSYVDNVLRVDNLSGQGMRCKIKVNGMVLNGRSQSVALAPGFELVASDHTLRGGEFRPPDGVARRQLTALANGHLGVNEFSLESVLTHSPIIVAMNNQAQDQVKDHRVLRDMSKMAAVLNHVYGPDGYSYASKTGIAYVPFVTQ